MTEKYGTEEKIESNENEETQLNKQLDVPCKGLLFQTPVLIHELQMLAERVMIDVEKAGLRWYGLLTADVAILELATMNRFLVQCNEALLISTTITHVSLVQNRHVAPLKSTRPNVRFIGEDGIMHPPQR